jgi:glycosyltransferase involved in cell wall biosynthesis
MEMTRARATLKKRMQPPPPWNVLLFSWGLDLGGTERQLAETALGLDRARFRPHVAAFHAHGMRAGELSAAGIPVVEFPVRSFARPAIVPLAWRFASWLRRNHIALVHAFDPPSVLFAVPVARLAGVPVVLASQRGERRFYPPAHQQLLKLTDRWAHAIVANSQFMRSMLLSYGAPARRIEVCYNGLNTAVFHSAGRRRLPGLETATCVIGCVAAQRPEKLLHTLIDAFAAVAARHAGLRLLLVGEGECRPQLEQQVAALGLAGEVLFAPATAEVAPWYRSIDIFVLPSESEAFSNSLLEAMACGCAVVATRVGGNPEAVTADTGRLFHPGDTAALVRILDELIADPELRHSLGTRAAQRAAREFSRAAALDCIEDLYEQLLAAV